MDYESQKKWRKENIKTVNFVLRKDNEELIEFIEKGRKEKGTSNFFREAIRYYMGVQNDI